MHIKTVLRSEADFIAEFWQQHWDAVLLVVHGVIFTPAVVNGFSAWDEQVLLGLITYVIEPPVCEVITLDSLIPRRGTATSLLDAVEAEAARAGCQRIFLVTTNDNLPALGFYQKRGYHLCALRIGAVDASRQLKPQIPLLGYNDLPIHDELELEKSLSPRTPSENSTNFG